jgi:hypothetical protein
MPGTHPFLLQILRMLLLRDLVLLITISALFVPTSVNSAAMAMSTPGYEFAKTFSVMLP